MIVKDRYVPTNVHGFVKDRRTGAVLNNDAAAYRMHVDSIRREQEINTLRDELDQLRGVVTKLLQRN